MRLISKNLAILDEIIPDGTTLMWLKRHRMTIIRPDNVKITLDPYSDKFENEIRVFFGSACTY